MAFSDAIQNARASVYERLGEDARWRPGGGPDGTTVRVRRRSPDAVVRFGASEAVVGTIVFQVRAIEVAQPAEGDLVESRSRLFKVTGDPTVDPSGQVWTCEAREVQA